MLKVHTIALVHYLQQRFHCSNDEIAKILNQNTVLFGRSIRGIQESIMIVERTIKEGTTDKNILTYGLSYYPEQMNTILSLKSIYGIDAQELFCFRNNDTHFPIDRCLKSAEILQRYNIPGHVVTRNKGLLFRNPGDLADDLELISSIVTDRKYFEHVSFGSLLNNIRRLKTNMKKQSIDFFETVDEKFIE